MCVYMKIYIHMLLKLMSNLTKLAATSLVHVWPAVDLTSAGSHGMLQLDVHVSVQFLSGCFSTPERSGVVVFKHSPTLPTVYLHCFFLFSTLLNRSKQCWRVPGMGAHGWVAGICLFYLGAGWTQWKPLDTPGTHLPFNEAAVNRQCNNVKFTNLKWWIMSCHKTC